jgi:signal transduction histidine kinase
MDPNGDRANPSDLAAPDEGPGEPYVRRTWVQELFEFATEAQLVTDGHGLILAANHAAAALLRCPKVFILGKPLGLFVVKGYRGRFYSSLSQLWQGLAADTFETRMARGGGSPRDVTLAVVAEPRDGTERARDATHFHWRLADVTDRKRAEADRADLLRRLVTAQEDERRRVARELHDSVGQLLTALTLRVKAARDAAPLPPATDARLVEVQRVADELGRTVRDLAVRLRPTALDDVGLHAALAQHVAGWADRTGVEVDFEAAAVEIQRLPADIETTIYRIVQESLTNVARHAKASRVSVTISRHGGDVTVAVEDDGVGFDPEAAGTSGRLGLVGMQERVALVGGTLDVESSPGSGTTVLARFPLRNAGGGGAL